ncbi:hypothetical protein [Phocaeicola sp.]
MNNTFISEQQVRDVFETLKQKAKSKIAKGKYEEAIHLIELAAQWGYFYTYKYSDDVLESFLQKIAKFIKKELPQNELVAVDGKKRIVFVCNRIADNCELVQQYGRALVASSIPTLIIAINRESPVGEQNILNDLQAANITIERVEDSNKYLDVVKKIAELISSYQPTQILAHVWPWDTRPIVAIMSAKQCPCYNINFNDHAFWIGKSMLDYSIEFRPYGSTISLEKRELKREQLLYLPYYPILSTNIPYQGFPFDRDGKVVILTGGSAYKMLGTDNLFFDRLDIILNDNSNAVVLLACGQLADIKARIKSMKNRNRVFTTSFRKDIASVFMNSDIYYGTYPMSGGLMSQYAAMLEKPIIAYAKEKVALDEMDGVVNYHNDLPIAFHSFEEMRIYAKRLCENERYRKAEGQRLYDSMIKQPEFETLFIDMMYGKHPMADNKTMDIDYDSISKFYLDYHNNNSAGDWSLIIKVLRLNAFLYFPQYTGRFLKAMLDRVGKKMCKVFNANLF